MNLRLAGMSPHPTFSPGGGEGGLRPGEGVQGFKAQSFRGNLTRRYRASHSRSRGRGTQIKPRAANQAGQLPLLGGMTDQSRQFVDDEQVGVFVNDVEHGSKFKLRGPKFKAETRRGGEQRSQAGRSEKALQHFSFFQK